MGRIRVGLEVRTGLELLASIQSLEREQEEDVDSRVQGPDAPARTQSPPTQGPIILE